MVDEPAIMPPAPSLEKLEAEVAEHLRRVEEKKQNAVAQQKAEEAVQIQEEVPCSHCGEQFPALGVQCLGRKILMKVCPACVALAESEVVQEKTVQAKSDEDEEWNALCPPLYRLTDLSRLSMPPEAVREVLAWSGPQGLALAGATGRGKTRLMFLLLKRLHDEGRKVFAISSKAFERHCGRMFEKDGESREQIERCARAEVLFLDDLGKERMTDRVESELYALIEERGAHLKPILWTTNADAKSLSSMMSPDRSEPIIRRLKEFSKIISV